jgi:hypothetical protein
MGVAHTLIYRNTVNECNHLFSTANKTREAAKLLERFPNPEILTPTARLVNRQTRERVFVVRWFKCKRAAKCGNMGWNFFPSVRLL